MLESWFSAEGAEVAKGVEEKAGAVEDVLESWFSEGAEAAEGVEEKAGASAGRPLSASVTAATVASASSAAKRTTRPVGVRHG